MKKLLCSMLVLATVGLYGQEVGADRNAEKDFNRWSLELNAGVQKPFYSMAENYYTSPVSFWHAGVGARYMFTNKFGAKLDAAYYSLENMEDESLPFKTNYLRFSLQGVANLGTILGLREVTDRFNFLVHAGAGYSQLNANEPIESDKPDHIVNVIAGITPQIRLSDNIALTGDLSMVGNMLQDRTWDGTANTVIRGVEGMMLTGSIGLTFYLGNKSVHADWYEESLEQDVLDSLEQRISKVENDLIDTDQDGVPDYLDREPNTPSGVAVDSKGYAVDVNKNGIPDELEESLAGMYAKKGEATGTGGDIIRKLINDGYVNVYFQFNSDVPATYSLESINYLIKYMTENPSTEGEIIGYADEIGEPAYNQQLSQRRAQRVKDILVASGVDANRLTVTGNGEDASVDKSSKPARQLVRRVTFRLK